MHAYSELYIERARRVLGTLLQYAVYEMGEDPDGFLDLFIQSGLAERFGSGDPTLLAGRSGIELYGDTIWEVTGEYPALHADPRIERTDMYWAGYVLAQYQWQSGSSFRAIRDRLSMAELRGMYPVYHEMDLSQAVEELERRRRLAAYGRKLGLKAVRENAGLSQSMLAERSGISVRSIQQYEQGQKDLRKAAYQTVHDLAKVLHVTPEELVGL